MDRLYLFGFLLVFYFTGLAKNNEKVLIRPDRVWVSISRERWETHCKIYDAQGFKGLFEQILYARLHNKKVIWENNDVKNAMIEENIDETEAWIREEDGKVYLLLDGWERYGESSSTTTMTEGLLYDFDAKKGVSYDGISMYQYYEDCPGYYIECVNLVYEIGREGVGEDEVESWKILTFILGDEEEDIPTQSYLIVEGIGLVEYSCLYYADTLLHTSGFNYYNNFYCYMDTSGNVLYPKDFKGELPGGGLAATKEIRRETPAVFHSGDMITALVCGIDVYD